MEMLQKKIWMSKYLALLKKTAFKTDFWPQDVPQPKNA